MAHARRKLYDIHVRTPSETTTKALNTIGELYAIEASIRGKPPDERLRVRQEKSKPLLQTYGAWLKAKLETLSAKSDTTKAIKYTLNQWDALTLYCDDGAVEIDHNLAENALRCVSMGRSLCTSFRNLDKHWELSFDIVATRAMFACQCRRNGLAA